MPNRQDQHASDRIRVDLIEADVDMAFGLVDDALEGFHEGNRSYAHGALTEAEKVLLDIESRLGGLGPENSSPFGPLVDELRKAIRAAQSECA